MRRAAAGALAAVPAALAGLSVRGLAGAAVIVVIVTAALCWIITDAGRSERLAMLICAWRGGTRQQAPRRQPAAIRGTGDRKAAGPR
jgi:hypothetical protein